MHTPIGGNRMAFAKLRKHRDAEPDLKELHKLKSQVSSDVYRVSLLR